MDFTVQTYENYIKNCVNISYKPMLLNLNVSKQHFFRSFYIIPPKKQQKALHALRVWRELRIAVHSVTVLYRKRIESSTFVPDEKQRKSEIETLKKRKRDDYHDGGAARRTCNDR